MEAKPQKRERRRIKLIKPRLQLKLIGIFVGISAVGFLMQAMHVALRLSELAATMPEGSEHLTAVMPRLPLEILLVSFGMVLPMTVAIGIVITHRIAGPVYRFEQYLGQVGRGEARGECRLRKGDEFTELAAIITEVTEPLREAADREPLPGPGSSPPESDDYRAAG